MFKAICVALLGLVIVPFESTWAADDPEVIYGFVVAIADGDTFTLLTAGKEQIRVRLAEIDTPERGQPYASKATDALAELVFQQTVDVEVVDIDRYGRTVGRVFIPFDADDPSARMDVNAEMVRIGAAWVYRKYANDLSLFELEETAKRDKLGIWGLSEAEQVPPWEWRRKRRESRKPRDVLSETDEN